MTHHPTGPGIEGIPDEMPSIDTFVSENKKELQKRLDSFDRQIAQFQQLHDRRKQSIQTKLADPETSKRTEDYRNNLQQRLEDLDPQFERDLAKLNEIRTQMENGNESKFRTQMEKVLSAIKKLKEGAEKVVAAFEKKIQNLQEYSQEEVKEDRDLLHELYRELEKAVKEFNTSFRDQDTTELYNREPSLINGTGGNQWIGSLLKYPMTLSIGTWRNEFNMHLSILGNIEQGVIKAIIPGEKAVAIAEAIENNGQIGQVEEVRVATKQRTRF